MKNLCAFFMQKGGRKRVLEKTNLDKVKMIARALLMTEIHENYLEQNDIKQGGM